MVKEAVDFRADLDSQASLQALLSQWLPAAILQSYRVMRGGYSGTNYEVITSTEERYALKICNGYSTHDVEQQAQCTAFLAAHGFASSCCYSLPLASIPTASPDSPATQYTVLTTDGVPATLLNFIQGRAADYIIETNPSVTKLKVLGSCGECMAALHRVKDNSITAIDGNNSSSSSSSSSADAVGFTGLRSYLNGGCCFLGRHVQGYYTQLFADPTTDEFVRLHPYVSFYLAQLPQLMTDLQCEGLPHGVLHGDVFLDNILLDETTGDFRGLVDWEDVCYGPLLFDLAVCIVGNCFDESNALSMEYLQALLAGYHRVLSPLERSLFVGFMKHALLCNATWRFVNFNLTHAHLRSEMGLKYLELQARLEHIALPHITQAIQQVVDSLLPPTPH